MKRTATRFTQSLCPEWALLRRGMRIAVFRPLGVGALLSAVPALRALDAAYPQAEITLLGTRPARELAARLGRYLERFAEFPGFPGLPGPEPDLDAVPEFFERVKAERMRDAARDEEEAQRLEEEAELKREQEREERRRQEQEQQEEDEEREAEQEKSGKRGS